jgi:hypothetical protein
MDDAQPLHKYLAGYTNQLFGSHQAGHHPEVFDESRGVHVIKLPDGQLVLLQLRRILSWMTPLPDWLVRVERVCIFDRPSKEVN